MQSTYNSKNKLWAKLEVILPNFMSHYKDIVIKTGEYCKERNVSVEQEQDGGPKMHLQMLTQ